MPALQHALLFGPFLEGLAADNTAEDLPEFEATLQAVNTVLRDKSNLTQIPKAVVYDVERILGIQVQMRKSSGQSKYATRLRHRNGFNEALIYLKFAGGVDPSRKELLARWMTPPAPHHNPPARPNAPPSAPEHPTRAQPAASAHEHKPRAIPSVPAPAAE